MHFDVFFPTTFLEIAVYIFLILAKYMHFAYFLYLVSTVTSVALHTENSVALSMVFLAKRIPLPACAYTKIRKEFPTSEEEKFTGFDLDEEH